LPLAVPLLAIHPVFVAYGSTGMETGLCALLVLLGLLALLESDRPAVAAWAGTAFILATLCRMDHGIFYAVGSGVVLVDQVLARRRGRSLAEVARVLAAWSAPFGLFVIYMLWKHSYYGAWLPNTYWAKSADVAWWSQGIFYSLSFWVGTLALLPLLLSLGLLCRLADPRIRRLALFSLGTVALFTVYTSKVGGDFMFGRFFVSVLPLVLLSAEVVVGWVISSGRFVPAALITAALLVSATPVRLFDGGSEIRGIVDENAFWPVGSLWPEVQVKAVHWKLGQFFRDEVVGRGLRPVIGTGGIGMVGYYSGLTLVDSRGLTDRVVARQELRERVRPGHEKRASRNYIRSRGVRLLRLKGGQGGFHPKRFRKLTRFQMKGAGISDRWQIATYDPELMRALAEVPGVQFEDFDSWLERYVKSLDGRSAKSVRQDLSFFKHYWFDHNEDASRLAIIEAYAKR